jgi:hypothetical protein
MPESTRVVLVSGDDFCWHGVRTLRGLEAAGRLARELGSSSSVGPGERSF